MRRREFLQIACGTALGAALGAPTLGGAARVLADVGRPTPGTGPYGPLQPANADGLQLPVGFSSRLLAISGQPVGSTGYTWHGLPDGGACAARPDGGWVYLSNGERPGGQGGVGAIAFDASGKVIDSYAVLSGTSRSCSGGMTPWGTYLSGEENDTGGVYECDPLHPSQGVHRPALGTFNHEMIAVDTTNGEVFMVEDHPQGRLYRFVPTTFGDLTSGTLYAAKVVGGGVTWVPTSPDAPDRGATTAFNGGEGLCFVHRTLFFTTKGDVRVWSLEPSTWELSVFYDGRVATAATPPASLDAVDNLAAHIPSGDLFVAEDGGNLELGLLTTVGNLVVAPFLRFVGHDQSEVSGIAFSPAMDRLYVSSQRGIDGATGRTYEVRGPFRRPTRRVSTDQPRVRLTGHRRRANRR